MAITQNMIINMADVKTIESILPNEYFDYGAHFSHFVSSYYAKVMQDGATAEEAKQALTESMLQTKSGIDPEKMAKAISYHVADGAYGIPEAAELAHQKQLHEKAISAYVDCAHADATNQKLETVKDGNLRLLLRVNPELNPVKLNEIYENRYKTGDFTHLLRETNEKVFTRENLKLLHEHGNDEAFLQDYPKLREIAAYAAGFSADLPGDQENLSDISKKLFTTEEYNKYRGKGWAFRNAGKAYLDHMSFLVDPISLSISMEQIHKMKPDDVTDAINIGGDHGIGKSVAHECGFQTANDAPASLHCLGDYLSSLMHAKSAVLRDQLSYEFAEQGVVVHNESLYTEDGKQLNNFKAYAHMVNNKEPIYMKINGSDKKYPIQLDKKDSSGLSFEFPEGLPKQEPAAEIAPAPKQEPAAEIAPAPKQESAPEIAPAPEPKRPGFFSRLVNALSQFFFGKPTETMRQYQEALELHQTETKLFAENKQLHEALKKTYGENYAQKYRLYSLDGTLQKNAVYALAHAAETGEMLYMQAAGSDEKIPIQLKNQQKGEFAFGKDVEMPKNMDRPSPPKEAVKPEQPGLFSRMISGIKEFFTGKPTETIANYRKALDDYHDYREATWKYNRDIKAFDTYQKTSSLVRAAQEKAKSTNLSTQYTWDKGKDIPPELIEKSYTGQQLIQACEVKDGQKPTVDDVTTIVTSDVMIQDAQKKNDPKVLDNQQQFKQTKTEIAKTAPFSDKEFVDKLSDLLIEDFIKTKKFEGCLTVADKCGRLFASTVITHLRKEHVQPVKDEIQHKLEKKEQEALEKKSRRRVIRKQKNKVNRENKKKTISKPQVRR